MAAFLHGLALRYFVEVARTGSLSDASARLHVAVSAISRQIAKLESELGAPLFERRPRGMALSEAGERLLGFAQRSLLEAEHVMKEIGGLDALHGSLLKIACSEGFAIDSCPARWQRSRRAIRASIFRCGSCRRPMRRGACARATPTSR